jgi:magnesium transporter
VLTALCHSEANGWVEVEDLSKVSELRAEAGSLVWAEVDVAKLEAGDIELIAEEFGLDRLAVEDSVRPRQRPKLEAYERHHFAVLHELYEVDDQLEKRQISCFVGDNYGLVIHEGAFTLLEEVRERLGTLSAQSTDPAHLLHVLVDSVVDEYQDHADRLEEEIEGIEDAVVGEARERVRRPRGRRARTRNNEVVQLRLYAVKQQIARVRRFGLPLQRVLDALANGNGEELLHRGMRPLWRDVHDHMMRIAGQVRNVDELADAVLDLIRTQQAEELSEVNKKLTGWAAIFALPTVIAGIYGMNYTLFPPWRTVGMAGFFIAIGLMVAGSATLYVVFKGKGWL